MECYHCGEECASEAIKSSDKVFCCNGCKVVFEILSANNFDDYYQIDERPGIKINEKSKYYFDFLRLPEFQEKLTLYSDEKILKTEFYIPQIHCNSCIWLLENLPKLNNSFIEVQVNFSSKKVQIAVEKGFTLEKIATFLSKLGYSPDFSSQTEAKKKTNKTLIYKVGVAGFCFGNIMLLTFPEYLGLKDGYDQFRELFLWISFGLSIPVTFYSGSFYLKNAIHGIKNKVFNMELPIAIGLLVLFLRSSFELFQYTGQAYFDSLAGLIFFLLIGKWFQDHTFSNLSFQRDYKSFFPIALQKVEQNQIVITPIEDLEIGDIVEIRNDELVPADALLISGEASLDYSFVTGETKTNHIEAGKKIFAGGKQKGSTIQIQLIKKTNNSYLTGLWNSIHYSKKSKENRLKKVSRLLSKYFTVSILVISLLTAVFWYFYNPELILKSVTTVLIIACPCALALSIPFTYGNALKFLSKKKVYFRKSEVIDELAEITDIVFDKTGTLTNENEVQVLLRDELNDETITAIKAGTSNSTHPISQAIFSALSSTNLPAVSSFNEITGKGIEFTVENKHYKLGSHSFIEPNNTENPNDVFVSCDSIVVARFSIEQNYRPELKSVLNQLANNYTIHVLSGDNDSQKSVLKDSFNIENAYFNQSPQDKLKYIQRLQSEGKQVLMLGDGLNDAGALKESDLGIAISNRLHSFTPASDVILDASAFHLLPKIIDYSIYCKRIVTISFIISLLYNVIGLSIAVQGIFAPVLAAILMPLSSISVVLFTTFSIAIVSKNKL